MPSGFLSDIVIFISSSSLITLEGLNKEFYYVFIYTDSYSIVNGWLCIESSCYALKGFATVRYRYVLGICTCSWGGDKGWFNIGFISVSTNCPSPLTPRLTTSSSL